MKNSSQRDTGRWILYGSTAVVLAGLAYFGFVYEAAADSGTLVGSARVQLRLGMTDEAAETVQQALEHYPEDPEVRLVAAETFARAEDYEQARRHLDHPSLETFHPGRRQLILGYIEEQQENWEAAVAAYRAALQHFESEDLQEQLHLGIASVQFRQKDFRSAIAECRKVSARWPDRPRSYGLMAECYRELQSLDEALVASKQAASLAPDDAGYAFLLGDIQSQMGNREAALTAFRRASELDLRSWEAQLRRAEAAIELEQVEEARAALRAAVALDGEAVERELTERFQDGDPGIAPLMKLREGLERDDGLGAPLK